MIAIGILVASALGLSVAQTTINPAKTYNSDALFGETGIACWVAHRLIAGDVLYRDVAYQYGPLSAYLYAGLAAVFGNSMATGVLWFRTLSLAVLVMLYALLRRGASPAKSLLGASLMGIPLIMTPGGLNGALTFSASIPLERLCLLGVALLWAPPSTRSISRSFVIGLLLGGWQGAKFGGAFVGGAAILITDGIALALQRGDWRPWFREKLATFAGFLIVQLALVALAFAVLPRGIAPDSVWPSWMVPAYYGRFGWRPIVGLPLALPKFTNGRYFVGNQLGPLALLGLALISLARVGKIRDLRVLSLFLPMFFFLVGLPIYFANVWLVEIWTWTLIGAAIAIPWSKRLGAIFLLFWMPETVALLANDVLPHSKPPVGLRIPTGDVIYLKAEEADGFADWIAAQKAMEGRGPEPPVFVSLPTYSLFHSAYDIPSGLRPHQWYHPGFARPYDEAELLSKLDHVRGLFVNSVDPIEPDPYALMTHVLSPDVCRALASRLGPPRRFGRYYWIFPAITGSEPRRRGL